MLNTHPHGKRLLFQGKAFFIKHGKSISGTVSQCQYHIRSIQTFFSIDFHGCHHAVFRENICHFGEKAHFASQRNDFLPNFFHNTTEQVCTNVRLAVVQDFLRRTCRHKFLQHLSASGVFDTGGQFPIGKCPCAPFTELNIVIHIQLSCLPELVHSFLAAVHIAATLQHNGLQTHLCQDQRRKHTRRAKAHNHRAFFHLAFAFREMIRQIRGFGNVFVPFHPCQHLGFIVHSHIHHADIMDTIFFPGIQ